MSEHIEPGFHSPFEIKAAVDDFGATLEGFDASQGRQDSDGADLGTKLDALTDGLGELKSRIDRLSVKAARPPLATSAYDGGASQQKSDFLNGFMRRGLEMKSLNISASAEGGSAVPEEIDGTVDTVLKDMSPIRAIANVVRIGSSDYKKLIAIGAPASGWVGEDAARPETGTPTFAEIAPPIGEIYANPAATQAMLDDARFDVEAWLSTELAQEFAVQEGAAFITGNGINKPKGFLDYATSAADDSARPFGTLQTVSTGVAGGFPAADPADILMDLVHTLRPAYRQNAVFVMNNQTLSQIRKFKDSDGSYLWRPGLSEGMPATLLGYPVVEAEDMPDVGAGAKAVAFGNFQRGYLVADRTGTRILRDPYSNKPFVHFYATRRVSGAVVDSSAIKLLNFAS